MTRVYLLLLMLVSNSGFALNSTIVTEKSVISDLKITPIVSMNKYSGCYNVIFKIPKLYPLSENRALEFSGLSFIKSSELNPYKLINPPFSLDLAYQVEGEGYSSTGACVPESELNTTYFVFHFVQEGTCPEVINIPTKFIVEFYEK